MLEKVLIVNRGEIAVRILRACTELGFSTVAICPQADKNTLHVQFADRSVCAGPVPSVKSYSNMDAILSVCKITGADVVHLGAGLLSENVGLAERREEQGICFIGPKVEVIRRMDDKVDAEYAVAAVGVPTIPGSPDVMRGQKEAEVCVQRMRFPVLIKVCVGDGGRGIRQVDCAGRLPEALVVTREEALRFFRYGDVCLEKMLPNSRHVEVQTLVDSFGNVVYLGECDYSLQRRHQKVLEERSSPSTALTDEVRRKMGEAVVRAVRQVGYTGAGTVESLLDYDGSSYLMETNTRIQVEHPITEPTWGVDLVEWQTRVARGERLAFGQSDLLAREHAIECRTNTETPGKSFASSVGTLTNLRLPGGSGIRPDTVVYEDYSIPSYYDNLLVKLIVHAPTREQAAAKMRQATREFSVSGVDINVAFQTRLLQSKAFQGAQYDICTLEPKESIAVLVQSLLG